MVLSTVTVTDTLRVKDLIVRATTKSLTDMIRIREIRFFSPVSIVISEAVKVAEEMASEIERIFRYISLHLGRGLRLRRAGDEQPAEV